MPRNGLCLIFDFRGEPPSRSRIMTDNRRHFLTATAALGFGLAAGRVHGDDKKAQPAEEVVAAEDLMREHGVLNRILLIYEEGLRRLRAKEDVPPEAFHKPAALVRTF